ncbi:MAG: hypothetical protein WC683_09915 [bacterium]
MNAPNDGRPGNGWTQAEEWVKRELDRLGDGQDEITKRINTLIMWMLAQTAAIVIAIFFELLRRHA